MLLSDVVLPALWALARGLLALAACLNSLLRGLGAACSAAAARTAVAAPALRPLLAALFALPPGEHIGSRPRAPTILGVVVAEDVQDGDWPAAIEALGRLLAWCVLERGSRWWAGEVGHKSVQRSIQLAASLA